MFLTYLCKYMRVLYSPLYTLPKAFSIMKFQVIHLFERNFHTCSVLVILGISYITTYIISHCQIGWLKNAFSYTPKNAQFVTRGAYSNTFGEGCLDPGSTSIIAYACGDARWCIILRNVWNIIMIIYIYLHGSLSEVLIFKGICKYTISKSTYHITIICI